MRDSGSPSPEARSLARVSAMLLGAYVLHLAEEWLGGFSAWTRSVLGNEVSAERFVLINGVALLIFAAGTAATFRSPRMAWFAASFAALVGLNGVLHALATVGFGRYSPGAVTGVLLYIPLSVLVLRESSSRLSPPVFTVAILAGILFHGLVALIAFMNFAA